MTPIIRKGQNKKKSIFKKNCHSILLTPEIKFQYTQKTFKRQESLLKCFSCLLERSFIKRYKWNYFWEELSITPGLIIIVSSTQ